MVSQKASEVANAFTKYAKTGDKSIIEQFTCENIEVAILQYHLDKGWPHYEAMEKRVLELKEEEGYRKNENRQSKNETKEEKRHKTIVMLTIISICVAFSGSVAWNIIYNIVIYPPKYILDGSSLHFAKYFNEWLIQEKKIKKNIDSYEGDIELALHFKLRNIHRGEGEITKPMLVVTAKNSNIEYEIKPKTGSVSSKREDDNVVSYTPVDLGRTIHVGSYGVVDEFFEYTINKDSAIVEFLKVNKDKLRFKIRGYPYKDSNVAIKDIDVDHIEIIR